MVLWISITDFMQKPLKIEISGIFFMDSWRCFYLVKLQGLAKLQGLDYNTMVRFEKKQIFNLSISIVCIYIVLYGERSCFKSNKLCSAELYIPDNIPAGHTWQNCNHFPDLNLCCACAAIWLHRIKWLGKHFKLWESRLIQNT